MIELFFTVLNLSLSASYAILAVLLLRHLLKKAPKWIVVVLWGAVALRLVCPFSLNSVFSLIPSAEVVSSDMLFAPSPVIDTGISAVNDAVNPILQSTASVEHVDGTNQLQWWIWGAFCVWVTGIAGMLLYLVISYFRLHKRMATAVAMEQEKGVYQSERIDSPFVVGIFRPRIYLPFSIGEKELSSVLAHERAHIRRGDHLWKPLGYLLLTIYWFNPLLWVGYIFLCRDIELACDEKVIKGLDRDGKADYSQAILRCSIHRKAISACPLAFGEIGVKKRVRSVLSYRKPTLWVLIGALISCLLGVIFFMTNPIGRGVYDFSTNMEGKEFLNIELAYAFPQGTSYRVEVLPLNNGEYTDDGVVAYDGSMGMYRVWIYFSGAEPASELQKRFPAYEIVELEQIKVKLVYPNKEQGFGIYLGFDHPVLVEDAGTGKLNPVGGRLNLKIKCLPKSIQEYADLHQYAEMYEELLKNTPTYDTALFDIDEDGVYEFCSVHPGVTSGIYTIRIVAREVGDIGIRYTGWETISSEMKNLCFETGLDGVTRLKATKNDVAPVEVQYMNISLDRTTIVLTPVKERVPGGPPNLSDLVS